MIVQVGELSILGDGFERWRFGMCNDRCSSVLDARTRSILRTGSIHASDGEVP